MYFRKDIRIYSHSFTHFSLQLPVTWKTVNLVFFRLLYNICGPFVSEIHEGSIYYAEQCRNIALTSSGYSSSIVINQ